MLDTEDASETDMAKLEEEFTEMKEQWVVFSLWVLWTSWLEYWKAGHHTKKTNKSHLKNPETSVKQNSVQVD